MPLPCATTTKKWAAMPRQNYYPEIVAALLASPYFQFKDSGEYLTKGLCPQCGEKSLYIKKDRPLVIDCNRKNKCGFSETVREALPELFDDFAQKHPATPEHRDATADAYLGLNRGFDLAKIRGWYEQCSYPLGNGQDVPTVRFYLDAAKTRFWERIIGKGRDGQKAHFGGKRKEDHTLYKGDVWAPPGFTLERLEECFIVEGIFHAIALFHVGVKAVAAFSCNNFPQNFFEQHAQKGVRWIWALDPDPAGKSGMRKHHKQLKNMGELSTVCLAPSGNDWDDLYRAGRITPALLRAGKHNGRLFLAESVEEKAYYTYLKKQRDSFILDYRNGLYDIKLEGAFAELLEPLVEETRQHICEAQQAQKKREEEAAATEPAAPATPPTPSAATPPEINPAQDARETALLSTEGRALFMQHVRVAQISNVWPQFLYMSRNEILDEQRYVFSIDYANGQAQDVIELEGTAITSPDSFHKALLNRSRGGTFDGDVRHLKTLRSWWLDNRMLTVTAVPYIGYDKTLETYIFQDHAWHKGRRIDVNPQGYFTIRSRGVKSSLSGLQINTSGKFNPGWIENYSRAFGMQGMCLLAFWLGSLFVQQIRGMHKSFPFLEYTGEPGAGKSTALEFCWKLVGRDDYEGFDLLKSSVAGRRRAFSQVSNLPVVIIESDRDSGEKDARQKQFGFDEVKPFWNGRGTGTLGVAKRGNDTDESLFQASLIISQNAEVDGSEALLQRIVHCHADKKHHRPGTREIARWFERQTSESVGGFLGAALCQERRILEAYEQAFDSMERDFTACGIKNERIVKNHAQIAACGSALRLLFPGVTARTVEGMAQYLKDRAHVRERRVGADHPMLEAFWEAYDYVNSRGPVSEQLNHAKDTEGIIALNLNHFREKCQDYGQAYPDVGMLKKLLPHTRRHKFVESSKSVRSRHEQTRIIKCWIFEKGDRA